MSCLRAAGACPCGLSVSDSVLLLVLPDEVGSDRARATTLAALVPWSVVLVGCARHATVAVGTAARLTAGSRSTLEC
jgi:hypothetical protein